MGRRKKTENTNDALYIETFPTDIEINPTYEVQTVAHTPVASERPSSTDPEWTPYIINQLTPDELWDGAPRVDGLRRLVEKEVDRIVATYVDVQYHAYPHPTVIVKATVTLANGEVYEASSDATIYSALGEFRNKLTAIADSRAKSKVYREILRLRNVSTSEEVIKNEDVEDDAYIQETQKNMINVHFPRDITIAYDITKVIEKTLGSAKRVDELRHQEAIKIMSVLNQYKQDATTIPDEVKV